MVAYKQMGRIRKMETLPFVSKVWELEESSNHNNYGEDDVCHLENVAHPEYCASVQDICRLSSTPGFLHSLRSGDL